VSNDSWQRQNGDLICFEKGYLEVTTEGKKGLMNLHGRLVIPPKYESIDRNTYWGIAKVYEYDRNRKSAQQIIDQNGEVLFR
jgi:WG containing repeat